MARKQTQKGQQLVVADALGIEQLVGLTSQLQLIREHPPLTRRSDGKYEGDILGFVKGLRLSAGVIYFLRERLSEVDCEVSWGHILDDDGQSCSPECDIIIHRRGFVRRWNGNQDPIMQFTFVRARNVLAVISCKSKLGSIDRDYPKSLKKYGVNNVFLFAECCKKPQLKRLQEKAQNAGYSSLCYLYVEEDESIDTNEEILRAFGDDVLKSVLE